MSDFEKQYDLLNDAQKLAVDTIEGPVIIVAGPGTGKTQILTLRIANILKKSGAGIDPENILALTFTNAGVVAMRERLAEFIGPEEAYRTNIYTFHSFCEDQIKQYPDYFPVITYSRVATDVEKIHIIEKILKKNEFQILKTFASDFHYIKDILHAIDTLKREGISPDDFVEKIKLQEKSVLADENSYYKRDTKKNKKGDIKPDKLKSVEKNKELQKIYELYQKELTDQELYDFADMIMQFVEVAENDEEFASIIREQYQYILVDEHQDTNEGQNRIIDVLTSAEHIGDKPNLFTVGDEKQAIYRFQGASIENFLHFEKKFPEAVIIHLEDNYRSAQGILDHAHTLISAGNSSKDHAELTAFKKDKADVTVKHFITYRDELVQLAVDIKGKIDEGVEPGDIAVFYRNNNNLGFIKEVFEKEGIPFTVMSKQNILDDVQVQKLIMLLAVINDPMNSEKLAKIILTDISPINNNDALIILEEYKILSRKISLYQLLQDNKKLDKMGISHKDEVKKFVKFIKKQIEISQDSYFLEFFEQFVRESGFLNAILSREDHIFLLKKLERLFDEVREIVLEKKGFSLKDFIKHVETFDEYSLSMDLARSSDIDGVNLMTAHGSKGLEFEHVYITNVVDGLWGGKRNIEKFSLPIDIALGDMEDERRLFYVAITRAKQSLAISYASHDLAGKEKMPSLFISDIDANFISMEDSIETSIEIFFAPRIKNLSSLISPDFIREKFLSTQLSATALNNYFDSPLLYFFRNLVRLPSAQSKTMLRGSVLHAALEKFFDQSKEGGVLGSKKDLLSAHDLALKTMRIPAEYYDSFEKGGNDILSKYYDKYKDDFSIDVLVEKKIKGIPFVLDSGEEILLTGAIDKIEFLEDGTVSVVDYKTGKTWSQQSKDKKQSLERQVVFYKLLLDIYDSGKYNMSEGMLDFIEPHRHTGELERHTVSVDSNQVLVLKEEINAFAKDILSGSFLEQDIKQKWGDKSLDEYIKLLQILQKHI